MLPESNGCGCSKLSLAICLLFADCVASLTPQEEGILDSLPPGMQTVIQRLPVHEQQTFLDMTTQQREQIVRQWSDRLSTLQHFTPAEQALISALARNEADAFFALPADKQEQFLVAVVERNTRQLQLMMTYKRQRRGG